MIAKWFRWVPLAITLLLLAALAGLLGLSASWVIYMLGAFALPFLLVCGAASIMVVKTAAPRRRAWAAIIAGLFSVPVILWLLILFPVVLEPRHRAFTSFYRDIHTGMSRGGLDALIARRFPPDGPRRPPRINADTTERTFLFMSMEAPNPNAVSAEGIFLTWCDGRLEQKEYSPD